MELSIDQIIGQKLAEVVTPLEPHQQRVIEKLLASKGLLVAHGVGSGKTLSAIAAADKMGLPSDVVVPAPLIANYKKELSKHLDEEPDNVRIRSYEKAVRDKNLNQEGLVILDEAHRARNSGTAISSEIARKAREAKARLLLTGTPVYNQPYDLANLVNTAAGKDVVPSDPNMFKNMYIGEKVVSPSFFQTLRGMKPASIPTLKNKSRLVDSVTGYVDVHKGGGKDFPSRIDERHDVEMSPKQMELYKFHEGEMPWYLRAKIRSGMPLTKQESSDLNAFQGALRQVSNSPRPYSEKMTDDEEERHIPKIQKMVDHLKEMREKNPDHKGVIYSNYLEGGLNPLSRLLTKANIPHNVFTGAVSKKERERMVKEYNEGKSPVLLVSSSGSEGLDLKGTRSIQLMEPHWNQSKLDQVIGRGIRYRSHAHLPEDQRNVKVMSYYSKIPGGVLEKLHLAKPQLGIEGYLENTSKQKAMLGNEIYSALEEASNRGPLKEKQAAFDLESLKALLHQHLGPNIDPEMLKNPPDALVDAVTQQLFPKPPPIKPASYSNKDIAKFIGAGALGAGTLAAGVYGGKKLIDKLREPKEKTADLIPDLNNPEYHQYSPMDLSKLIDDHFRESWKHEKTDPALAAKHEAVAKGAINYSRRTTPAPWVGNAPAPSLPETQGPDLTNYDKVVGYGTEPDIELSKTQYLPKQTQGMVGQPAPQQKGFKPTQATIPGQQPVQQPALMMGAKDYHEVSPTTDVAHAQTPQWANRHQELSHYQSQPTRSATDIIPHQKPVSDEMIHYSTPSWANRHQEIQHYQSAPTRSSMDIIPHGAPAHLPGQAPRPVAKPLPVMRGGNTAAKVMGGLGALGLGYGLYRHFTDKPTEQPIKQAEFDPEMLVNHIADLKHVDNKNKHYFEYVHPNKVILRMPYDKEHAGKIDDYDAAGRSISDHLFLTGESILDKGLNAQKREQAGNRMEGTFLGGLAGLMAAPIVMDEVKRLGGKAPLQTLGAATSVVAPAALGYFLGGFGGKKFDPRGKTFEAPHGLLTPEEVQTKIKRHKVKQVAS